ncbi:flavoprotein [Streptomyces sp. NPDC001262]|uniref:flavoprotein n=1 Tax=Streptomyces sp. NPDC001262 TaxID=3364552 RepID=UPI0036CFF887
MQGDKYRYDRTTPRVPTARPGKQLAAGQLPSGSLIVWDTEILAKPVSSDAPSGMISLTRRGSIMRPVLHLVGCGTRPTEDLPDFAAELRIADWEPHIIASPVGRRFVDTDHAAGCSGQPVRWDLDPDDPVSLPKAHCVAVAPATFNTITKLAAGIADTLALAVTAEAVGARLPVVVVPWMNSSLANHPQYDRAMRTLREWGVQLLPADQSQSFPWALLRERLDQVRTELVHAS